MKIQSKALGMIVMVVIFGGIGLTSAFNLWRTESLKVPVKFIEGQFAGEYNPADIRGSYTFGDINRNFRIPLEVLAQAFGVTGVEDVASFQNKNLESLYGYLKDQGKEIGNASVKLFVALYTGLPYQMDEPTYLPAPAVTILKERGGLTAEQLAYLDAHGVDITRPETVGQPATVNQPAGDQAVSSTKASEEKGVDTPPGPVAATPAGNTTGAASNTPNTQEDHKPKTGSGTPESERTVKGNTIFREVLDWGLSREVIEEVLGEKMPNPLTNIQDYCMQKGIKFGTVKQKLQEKIDALN